MSDKPVMDHASKVSFWKKIRKTKSTTFSSPRPAKDEQGKGWLAALAEHELEHASVVEPPRRGSMYSLQRNPTSEDLPTLTISDTSVKAAQTSQTLPTRAPSSFDMLFSRSSSSSRSKYAFTPPLERSDTEASLNPRSLFEIRAFASAIQRLHNRSDSVATLDGDPSKDDKERKRRTLKSARMRPATSASSSEGSGPFRSVYRYPLTPYPERASSLWGLWDDHDPKSASTGLGISEGSSPTTSTSSGWPSSANTSATSVNNVTGRSSSSAARWHAATASMKSPSMVNAKSSTGQSMCGEVDVLRITPQHESLLSLHLLGSDNSTEGDNDFSVDVHKRLKEIMGIDPVI